MSRIMIMSFRHGSEIGRVGYRVEKGRKVWCRLTKSGSYRKLSKNQLRDIKKRNPQFSFSAFPIISAP